MKSHIHHIRLLVALIPLLLPFQSKALQLQPKRLSLDSLYKCGQESYAKGDYKNALAFLETVTERYTPECPPEETGKIISANVLLGNIYSFQYFDNAKAYEATLRADRLAKETGQLNAHILFNLAGITQTIAEQAEDSTLMRKAYEYFKDCVSLSLYKGPLQILDMAMSNYLILGRNLSYISENDSLWSRYAKAKAQGKGDRTLLKYNTLMRQAIMSERNNDMQSAVENLQAQLHLFKEEDNTTARYIFGTYLLMYEMINSGNPSCRRTEDILKEMSRLSERHPMSDARLLTYKFLWQHYATAPCTMSEKAAIYAGKYISLKDSLLNYQQVASLKKIEASSEMERIQKDIDRVRQRNLLITVALICTGVLCVAIAVFIFILRRRNRQLMHTNWILYNRTVDYLKRENSVTKELHVTINPETPQQESAQKKASYSSSHMSETDKKNLMETVRSEMSKCHEIYSPDFTATRFADIIGIPQRNISLAIGESGAGNFIQLLNEYRIKEACRRLTENPDYKVMTIEAVGNSVGFRARSSFIAAFKKFTGLTPSQYQKMSRLTSAAEPED